MATLGNIKLNSSWQSFNGLAYKMADGTEGQIELNAALTYSIQNTSLNTLLFNDDGSNLGEQDFGGTEVPSGYIYEYKSGSNPLYVRTVKGEAEVNVRDNS